MPTTNGAAYPQISNLSAFGKIAEKSEKVQKNNFSIKLRLTFYNDNWLHLKTAQRQNRFVSFFFFTQFPSIFSVLYLFKIFSKFFQNFIGEKLFSPILHFESSKIAYPPPSPFLKSPILQLAIIESNNLRFNWKRKLCLSDSMVDNKVFRNSRKIASTDFNEKILECCVTECQQ
jgi:hypothetical protein